MTAARTLVLDLDGTLVDTASDLTATLNDILAQEGLPAISPEDGKSMVGHGARAMLSNALLAAGATADTERLDNLVAVFMDIYAGRIAESSRPYPGIPAALDRFAAAGWRLAVCTNKFERHSKLLLAELGIADRFAVIAGQDTYGMRKPDPHHLLETIREAGGSPTAAVMVGDSEVDVQTARNASVPVVAVDFGYCPVPVADLAPDRVISHFDELFDIATGLMERG